MISILHYLKDPKLWELLFSPYTGYGKRYVSSETVARPKQQSKGQVLL